MSLCKNTVESSDISSNPILLKYSQQLDCGGEAGIEFTRGVNGQIQTSGSVNYKILVYRTIRQLYYMNYISGSLLGSGSGWDSFLQSTAASGTYEYDNRYFPTESNAQISVMTIPKTVFGEKISPKTFNYFDINVTLADDGNGNIIDLQNNNTHVGNIIYPHGVVVLTNQNYQNVFPEKPILVGYYGTFNESVSPKTFSITSYDSYGSGQFDYSTLQLFGTDQSNLFSVNLTNGQVTLNTTEPGEYTTYYSISNYYGPGCALKSDPAKCVIVVNDELVESLDGAVNQLSLIHI